MNITQIKQHWNVEHHDTYAGLPVYRVSDKMTPLAEDKKHCYSCTCAPEAVPVEQQRMEL